MILGCVVLVGVLTVLGVLVTWPDGEGRAETLDQAADIGLVTERFDATVKSVTDGQCSYATIDDPQECRAFTFIVHEGPAAGSEIALAEFNLTIGTPTPDLNIGDAVVLGYEPRTNFYFYADRDRGPTLLLLTLAFVVVVLALGRWRGLNALAAMAITVVVLIFYVAPSVLDGNDPLIVAVAAASAIAFVSLYLTHGFTPTTTVALAGTLASLGLTLAISSLFFSMAQFTGLATEEGSTLPFVSDIDLSALLLGGAILGTLGALDDVTVTQVATVAELRYRNEKLTTAQLVTSGIRVGREHIASTVNTLLLAYVGASMPLLLVIAASDQALGAVANSELVAVEIVRTLCGSIGLVAAVPITTLIAATLVGGPSADDDVEPAAEPPAPDAAPFTVPREVDTRPEPQWDDFAPDDVDL
ncbi:MAG: YibE/F family protein [Actinomycetota bacterium]